MPAIKVPARDWTVEVRTGEEPDVFIEVGGLTTLNLGQASERTDTTDFDSEGQEEGRVMQRGRTLGLEGFFKEDPDDGARDAGQAAVESLGQEVGESSVGRFRVTSPGGTVKTFDATVELGDQGGGNNDMTSWAATLTRTGADIAA